MSAEPQLETAVSPACPDQQLEKQNRLDRQRLFNAAAMITELGYIDPDILYMPAGRPIDTKSFPFRRATEAYLGGEDAWQAYLLHDVVYHRISP